MRLLSFFFPEKLCLCSGAGGVLAISSSADRTDPTTELLREGRADSPDGGGGSHGGQRQQACLDFSATSRLIVTCTFPFFSPVESEAAVQCWLQNSGSPCQRWPCCPLQDNRKPLQEASKPDSGFCQSECSARPQSRADPGSVSCCCCFSRFQMLSARKH